MLDINLFQWKKKKSSKIRKEVKEWIPRPSTWSFKRRLYHETYALYFLVHFMSLLIHFVTLEYFLHHTLSYSLTSFVIHVLTPFSYSLFFSLPLILFTHFLHVVSHFLPVFIFLLCCHSLPGYSSSICVVISFFIDLLSRFSSYLIPTSVIRLLMAHVIHTVYIIMEYIQTHAVYYI